MDTLTLRVARPEDAAQLAQAERTWAATPGLLASRPHELQDDTFLRTIVALADAADGHYLVAEEGGAIVGHGLLVPMGLASIRHIVRLTLVVHPGHEGRGIGNLLLQALLDWARAAPSVIKVELNVRASNARAIRLYEKHQFKLEGRHLHRIRLEDNSFLDDLEMGLFV